MIKKRSAQTQIITIVLITGIIIGTIGSTLYWGQPLIEKTKTTSELSQAVSLMKEVERAIDEVAASEESRVLLLNIKGDLKIEGAIEDPEDINNPLYRYNNDENPQYPIRNSITYTVEVGQAVSSADWIPLDGNPSIRTNSTGYEEYIPGTTDNKPGVIMLKTEVSSEMYNAILKLGYRELVNLKNGKGYVTQLVNNGPAEVRTYKDSEPKKLVIKFDRKVNYPRNATTGETLVIRYVNIGFE